MTGIWPGKTQCVVLLTFDVDGVSGLLRLNPEAAKRPTLLSVREFGPKVGLFRILDLLDKYRVPATFFIPGYIAERNEETVRDIMDRGHEVGHHGYLHEPPATLEPQQEAHILDKGTAILEGITGQQPLGYRSPSWDLGEHTLDFLAERGFMYDSSLMAQDVPYFVDTPKGRLVELPVRDGLCDTTYFLYNRGAQSMNTPQDVHKAWEWEFGATYQVW